jgi:hypothetical protein
VLDIVPEAEPVNGGSAEGAGFAEGAAAEGEPAVDPEAGRIARDRDT